MKEKKPLWDKLIEKLKGHWIGITIILITLIIFYGPELKDKIDKLINEREYNNEMYSISNSLDSIKTALLKGECPIDSLKLPLNRYLSLRNSVTAPVEHSIKQKEDSVKELLLDYAYHYKNKGEAVQFNDKNLNDDIRFVCTLVLTFCEKSCSCSQSEIETLTFTKNEIQ